MTIKLVTCHRMPERSFFWKGKQFPVCARCTGIYLGYLSFPLFNFDFIHLSSAWSIAITLPTVVDGLAQAFMQTKSNNFIRVTTGIIGGIGVMSFIINIGTFIGNLILK